jgi:hypothetical protein
MPTQTLNLSTQADGNGAIGVEKSLHSPVTVTIKRVTGTLIAGRPGRTHELDITVNDRAICSALLIHEGAPFIYAQAQQFKRGQLALRLSCAGFAANETVTVTAQVEFAISIF